MSEFSTSERIAATTFALGLLGLALWGNGMEGDVNHYIQNAPSPHSQNGSIPKGKVLPPDATVQFLDGSVEYQAPTEVATETGLFEVTAFCGNPIDKRDPQNLYAVMSIREEDDKVWEVMAGIAAAAACADGTIDAADRSAL